VFKAFQLTFLLLLASLLGFSQEVKVHGYFDADTVKLGEPLKFYLTATYPQTYQVLFPDSTYSFAPFEFQNKRYFQTKTTSGLSYDSVIYTLATYEIDKIQTLTLPVFQLQKKDSLTYFTDTDTVYFKELVGTLPDSLAISQLPLKTNTAYNPVSWLLNYPLLLIIGAVLLLIAIVCWIVFGKRIRKYFTLKKLVKSHELFLTRFDEAVEKLKAGFSPEVAESSVTIWKKYMEELSSRPYTKFTSREIREQESSELGQPLRSVDRMIYGRLAPETFDSFHQLKEFTKNQFNQKVEEVKHG
jgi:hypothetical protein